jgi:class 3 adenylate cyclase/tetratricopeptide (TPR) repeat protein
VEATVDVAAWLKNLGLERYEAAFRDNAIDGDLLPSLTAEDLKDLGVTIVGHRRKLLDAIAAVGVASKPKPPPAPADPPGTLHAPAVASRRQIRSGADAERRPITVVFCDLVGSTSMAAKLDAEDWRTLVSTYLDEASAAVAGLGGHVLKKLGDGLMALFGYPHAQENDAERAVRAALAIQRALVEINARNASKSAPELAARIGLDSGQVVVDATGEVFGEAPNIAARVQSAAEPGSILITATVQRQTAGLFVAEDHGQHELKGMSAPMTLYRIVRASGGGRRGGARALTPLVGREEELDLLARRWQRARKGEGQLALIVGEPGLGKSRLMEEFHARLGETPHTWVEWSSSQLLQNTPLHPIAEWGRQRFGADLPAEQRLADLEHTLQLVGLDPTEYAPLLAPLVDVLLPEDRAAKLAPEELRRRQLAAMTAWILAAARTQAIVLAFEDLHWADPTSLDLMRALAERGAQAPLLIIATARPEFRAPWSVRSHHSVISLSPLDSAEIAKMVRDLSSRHALPKDIVEGVSERTGGVPLYVEEVTRLLLERGEQGGAQAIPPTLQQSLAARLDQLGSARETAQIGAVLGRDFSYALLQSVAGLDEGALRSALERLAEADILFVEGDGAQATYRFKHALIQDAAYDSLLKSRRQALHRRAAEIMRDGASPEPEAIAHHFTQAGLDDQAIEWWGKAGDQALRRSAFQEAVAHLGKAIEMADKAGGARAAAPAVAQNVEVTVSERFRRQRLQVAYGNALIAARGHTAPETTEAFAKVRESVAGGADLLELAAADYGLWVASYGRGELPPMRVHSAAFLEDVAARPDSVEACVAHRVAGSTHWFAGEYREAREHLERAVALFQPGRDDDVAFRFGQDAGVAATLFLALVLWVLGDVARAIALAQQAHERVERIPHASTRAYGKLHMALFELIRGEVSRAVPTALELGRVARENDLPLFRALAVFLEAWTKSQTAESDDAREEMSRAADVLRQRNIRCFDGPLKFAHAQEEGRLGDPERAISIVDDAMADFDRRGHRAMDAELRRVRGEILLKRHPANPGPAEEALKAAIAIAKEQGARSFELRAALSLAKLYQSTARPADAHAALAPALEGFSPTLEMPEIAEAAALLASLSEMDEVKSAEAQRRRRLHLQTAYGQAMMWAKGFAAEETQAAFSRATELTAKSDDFAERFAAAHFQWTRAFLRGELRSAGELESSFLKEAEDTGRVVEAGVARRGLALACYQAGDFQEARIHCERALEACEPDHERETQERFHDATGPIVMSVLAVTMWQLGEVDRAREMIEQAAQRARDLGHGPSMTHPLLWRSHLEILRGDAAAALPPAEALADLGLERGMPFWRTAGEMSAGWARGRLRDAEDGAADLRRALAERAAQGGSVDAWLHTVLLAELEAKTLGVERALARIEEAMTLTSETENRCNLSFPHLLRGELLLKRDPTNPAPADQAFQTAIAIAKEQGARSWNLRSALSLAKLRQSTGRHADAHAVLMPALEGFAPTPEMPEIAEAQALMKRLA